MPSLPKRKSKTSPTQRSLALIRKQGLTAAISEHWCPFSKRRKDLFGFIDILVIDTPLIGVQTTSGVNVSHRVAKIRELQAAQEWLEAGNRIMVHGWAKRGARGEVKRWTCREVEVTLEDFDA